MLARVETCTVVGVDALPVRVEVNLTPGLPSFTIVGMAQGAVREGRERVTAALVNSGYALPLRRITVNLAPAGLRKEGTAFDLPIALGILAGSAQLRPTREQEATPVAAVPAFVMGELGLDGAVRPVTGVLPAAVLAREAGLRRIVVPVENAPEARVIEGVDVWPVRTLAEAVEAVISDTPAPPGRLTGDSAVHDASGSPSLSGMLVAAGPDLADVRGQEVARRALEISAAGGHNLLLVGPPGVGKTMLARRLPGILPPLTTDEALEVARVRSVAGRGFGPTVSSRRPFRAPHHTVSYAGLVGGGAPLRPGEISLAHRGVLFLDELGEFDRRALESLRQPLEHGTLSLARAAGTVRLPARFVLVGAMNPCPCGHLGDGTDRCTCDDRALARYAARVSGPLMDRLDVRVELTAPGGTPFDPPDGAESSAVVAERVAVARAIQDERYRGAGRGRCNGEASTSELGRWGRPEPDALRLLQRWANGGRASARAVDRTVRVARTIADLEECDLVGERHLAEALHYRATGAAPAL